VDAMGGEFHDVRSAAADALGEIKDPRAVEPLIDMIKDPHRDVREEAARSLGKIKDRRAVEPLIFVVRNDKDVKGPAIWSLGEIGDPRAVDVLISVLKGEIKLPLGYWGMWGNIDGDAAIALGKIGGPAVKPLISAFKSALEGKNWNVEHLSEKALKGIEDQRAVELLIPALKDNEWKVREIVADLLGGLGDHRAVEALIDALVDKHPLVQSSVEQALRKITGKDFGYDQMKWKKWSEGNLKETPGAKIDKLPMWVFEPLTQTSNPYSPRYPRRLRYTVSEISMASDQLVYYIEVKSHYQIKQKTDQLVFLANLIVAEMKAGLKGELETLRPDVAEELKNNFVKILKETEEIISLSEAPAFQNNLEKIKSTQKQINETSRKIAQQLE